MDNYGRKRVKCEEEIAADRIITITSFISGFIVLGILLFAPI